jgi:glycerol-3-phosphate acyltransferase PlsY
VLGKKAAAFAFGGDALKGIVATLIAIYLLNGGPWAAFAAALGAVVGHTYSPWIGFNGGRGVVTGMCATFVVAPLLMTIAIATGLVLMATTKYVSLGSVVGATVGGLLMIWLGWSTGELAYVIWGLIVAGAIDIAHRDNIGRLLNGTERRLGEKPTTS